MSPTATRSDIRFRLNAILHPTDFSDESLVAFHHALVLSRAATARLDLLHAEPDNTEVSVTTFPGVVDTLVRWKVVGANPDATALRAAGVRARRMMAPGREPADAIVAEMADARSDLVVLATHGRSGLAKMLQPSVTEAVVRLAQVPVLVIPPGVRGFVDPENGKVSLRRILVAVAPKPAPDVALHVAISLGRELGLDGVTLSTLFVGAVGDAPGLDVHLPESWVYHSMNRGSQIVKGIVETATDWAADLLVITSAGHDSLADDLRGSTAERLLRTASCPVLIVPSSLPS